MTRAAVGAFAALLAVGGTAHAAPGTKSTALGDGTARVAIPVTKPIVDPIKMSLPPHSGWLPCRQGYVWREAGSNDSVCVEPRVRDQASSDNAQAAARRAPGNGGHGPDACATGYVWREAYPGDVVCVEPAVREQARSDNAQADDRRVAARLWLSLWSPAPKCDGEVCSKTSTEDIPRIQLNGDHYNFGKVLLTIQGNDGDPVWSGTVDAARNAGLAGGSFTVRTSALDCSAGSTRANGFAQAYDTLSGRWSPRIPLPVGCEVL
ncbi:hypothetical protein ACF1G0_01430 [Streptomyces sp. NPDC013953]|uniref:hypothetical protein n=1 Tax=Streptomyces sp. NPDC013953 TaxID=3364868 RepID=UPI0036F65555